MKKITDLKERRFRTEYSKDKLGNRVKKTIPYIGPREVIVVQGGRRFAHFFVDLVVFECFYALFSFILSSLPIPSISIEFHLMLGQFSISLFDLFLYPAYYFIFELLYQKTPGKFLTKTSVIDVYGNKPTGPSLLLRSIIRLVPFEAFSCLGYQGWHDRWSDTYVVRDAELKTLKELLNQTNDVVPDKSNIETAISLSDREVLIKTEKQEELIDTFRKNYHHKSSAELLEILADKRFIQEAKDVAQEMLNERDWGPR